MSTFRERLDAMMGRRHLRLDVDLACYSRLEAMMARIQEEDEELRREPAIEPVVLAAIMGGLRASEREAGVVYDESTGRQVERRSLTPDASYYVVLVNDGVVVYVELPEGVRTPTTSAGARLLKERLRHALEDALAMLFGESS